MISVRLRCLHRAGLVPALMLVGCSGAPSRFEQLRASLEPLEADYVTYASAAGDIHGRDRALFDIYHEMGADQLFELIVGGGPSEALTAMVVLFANANNNAGARSEIYHGTWTGRWIVDSTSRESPGGTGRFSRHWGRIR